MKFETRRPAVATYRWECVECSDWGIVREHDAARQAMREAKRHIVATVEAAE